jgi:hypothetical protein
MPAPQILDSKQTSTTSIHHHGAVIIIKSLPKGRQCFKKRKSRTNPTPAFSDQYERTNRTAQRLTISKSRANCDDLRRTEWSRHCRLRSTRCCIYDRSASRAACRQCTKEKLATGVQKSRSAHSHFVRSPSSQVVRPSIQSCQPCSLQ